MLRQEKHLREFNKGHWDVVDHLVKINKEEGGIWHKSCLVPTDTILMKSNHVIEKFAESKHIEGALKGIDEKYIYFSMMISCFAAWRVTKGIYRYDNDVYEELKRSEVKKVPGDVIFTLPEWCVYIETPEYYIEGERIYGFYAYIDANSERLSMRFMLDLDIDILMPVSIPLEEGEDIWKVIEKSDLGTFTRDFAEILGWSEVFRTKEDLVKVVGEFLSLVLYLCTEEPDMQGGDSGKPTRPKPKKTRKYGERYYEAKRVTVWETGFKMGKMLRDAKSNATGTGVKRRAHVRCAHWHTYWIGKRGKQSRVLRWIHPILVGGGSDIPTVRKVK